MLITLGNSYGGKPFCTFNFEYIELGPGIVAQISLVCLIDTVGTSNSTYTVPGLACFKMH